MPIIKRYPDGSVFDYENGHRTAETVARQKAEGTYSEPSSELQDPETRKRFVITSIILALAAIVASVIIWNFATGLIYENSKNQYVKNAIEDATGGEVLQTKDNDQLLLRSTNEEAHMFEGPQSGHQPEQVIVPCEATEFTDHGKDFVAVSCTGFNGSLVVELPKP
jgi:hypothetical protein